MVSSHTDRGSLSARLRAQRMGYLDEALASFGRDGLRLADLGGTCSYWEMNLGALRQKHRLDRIDLFNLETRCEQEQVIDGVRICNRRGDVTELDVPDGSYDIAFSNSVIEHVGNLATQARFADEIRRIARRFVLQTPNRKFPLEPHFYVPFFAFMPLAARVGLHRRFNLGWLKREPDRLKARIDCDQIRLLSLRELRLLFPGAVIHKERLFGMIKSFIVCSVEEA